MIYGFDHYRNETKALNFWSFEARGSAGELVAVHASFEAIDDFGAAVVREAACQKFEREGALNGVVTVRTTDCAGVIP